MIRKYHNHKLQTNPWHRTTITRHQKDKLSKGTSSLFPIKMIAKLEWTQSCWTQKMLANHFHLRLMTMYIRLYITDPLNGVLKQNLMKTVLSKSFSVKILKDVWYIFISNNITIYLYNCHSSPLNSTGYLLKCLLI